MVNTIKFSEMTPGGDLANDEKTPGLLSGANVLFNNPWTFLPPGTTAERPAPSAAINYRLRFNTDDQLYEYYDAVLGQWTQLQESAFTVGPFVTYTADASLPDAQNLGLLANGILKQTITLGVATLDIAANGVDYYGPGFTGYLVSPSGIADFFSNPILNTTSPGALAVNYVRISSNIAGNGPTIAAAGSDTNIALNISSKGSGPIGLITQAVNQALFIYNGTANQHLTRFSFANTAADRTVTWQDASGTVAFIGNIPVQGTTLVTTTPYAVLESDDIILVDTETIAAPSSIVLPAAPTNDGQVWTIKDYGFDASTYHITISVAGGGTIDFQSTYTLADDDSAVSIAWSASEAAYYVVSTFDTLIPVLRISGNSGTAVPNAGIITINGGTTGLTTSASGSTLSLTGVLNSANGGTGVNNGSSTITLGGSLSTIGAFTAAFTMTGNTAVTFPTSGTLATTSQLPTPSALTKTDDTNVTLSLGGSPTVALLAATSLTLGWTGQLSGARGGTGVANTGLTINLGAASTGYILTSDVSGNATWQAPGYLTGAVLLTPAGDQDITVGSLTVSAGEFISGKAAGGFAGGLLMYSPTANLGRLLINASDAGAGNFSMRITNASFNQATVITIPDPVAASSTFLLSTAGATQHVTAFSFQVDAGALISGLSTGGTAGRWILYSPTSANGFVQFQAANNGGNFGITLANDSFGQASSINIPDPGGATAKFLLDTSATNKTLNYGLTLSSVNFGQTTLSNYTQSTFTPTVTSASPGDLSVSYASQEGFYTRIGRMILINYTVQFTPTFTTATGVITFGGLPVAAAGNNSAFLISTISTGWTWPAGKIIVPNTNSGTTNVLLQANASTAATANCSIETTLVSGVQVNITFSGMYYV
jgi:hypothetical protein